MTTFSAHNIRFADGSVTMPDAPHLLADVPWCEGTKRVLHLLYGDACAGKRIADLGCLEGGYALEFARLGFDTLGVEVRQSNYDNCLVVRARANLPNLDFARDDVLNLPKYGQFDVIFCCGLLYHLEDPRAFIHMMGRQARDAVIINTHYAPWDWYPASAFTLSAIDRHEGLPGRWFGEHDATDDAAREQLKWASWKNQRSFWPMKEALLHSIKEAGFDLVFEQFDTLGDILSNGTDAETVRNHRGVFVGIRGGLAARSERGAAPADTSTLTAALNALIAEKDALTAQAAAREAEVAAIRTSTSWRVTAPLRAMRRGLSRTRV